MKCLLIGIFCAMLVASPHARAENSSVRINSMALGEGLQQVGGSGFYADAARGVLAHWGGSYTYRVTPFKRAVRNFRSGASDCIWALDLALLEDIGFDVSSFVQSTPLLMSSQRIFTRHDKPVIHSLQALKGKKVGVLIGTNLEAELRPIGAEIVELNSQEAKLAVLELNRVDAVLGWMPDVAITAKIKGFTMPNFDRALAVRLSGVGFVCHDDDVGRRFIGEVDSAITTFQTSGAFETLKVSYLGLSHSAYGI